MGAEGRDRATGRTLPSGWDEAAAPAAQGAPTGRSGPHPAADGADGPETAASPHGPSGPSRRSRRLIAVCTVLVLVAGLLVALPRLLGAVTEPERVTREFLQSVVDGDLETVRAHAQDSSDASAAALTAEVLAGAEDRLDSFEIRHVEVGAGTATVTAELRAGSERGNGTFTLSSSDDGPFSPTAWELTPVVLPELRIDLTFGVQEVEIGGVAFPLEEIRTDGEAYEPRVAVQLLPGSYEVRLPRMSPWARAPRQALEVPAAFGSATMHVHDLQLVLDEVGRSEVQHQVDAALEECANSTSRAPEGCPFAVPDPEAGVTSPGGSAPVADRGTWTLTSSSGIEAIPLNAFLWRVVVRGSAEYAPADGAPPIEVTFAAQSTANITGQGTLEVRLEEPGEGHFDYCIDAESGVLTGVIRLDGTDQGVDPECP